MVDRVRIAIAMEGIAAYPQSSDGRLAGSDPEQTTLGEIIEDRFNYDDDDFANLSRLDKAAQAAVWRGKIEQACNAAEMAALRIYYGMEGRHIEQACEVMGQVLMIEGRSSHYVKTGCWILARKPSDADETIANMVLDVYHVARKKASMAVE